MGWVPACADSADPLFTLGGGTPAFVAFRGANAALLSRSERRQIRKLIGPGLRK